ncbi:hypothetical protein P0D88_33020 [Paraburkholderia sp. RL18-103-BIB-C]|uniref:DUF6963 family protein n=1 Tax=Paraburkholderia sp. RL18-103-BIB-C TaxID=3031637 RepID=UPI0038B9B068
MTIGICAHGPNAGLAIFEALRIAEKISRGAIGGFVSYAVLSADGRLIRHETQRGGSRTLFICGESTGLNPPEDVASATSAALISSGPDRPSPLSQFLAADVKGGLVTGHRLPNGMSVDGEPLNLEVLDRLIIGQSAQEAVDGVIERNPEADVGLIAVDRSGEVWSRNSERVRRRPDLGHARRVAESTGAVVEVLHNAIYPCSDLAPLVASVALETMVGVARPTGWVAINAGIPVVLGAENAIYCGRTMVAEKIVTTDPTIIAGHHICTAIYLHSTVYIENCPVGRSTFEPLVTVIDGKCTVMSGQTTIQMGYTAI